MHLSDRDKQIIKDHIDRGDPLPPRYKPLLFADAPEVELIWAGKTDRVENTVLPFQSIEQIDEPREESHQEPGTLFDADAGGRQSGGWTNKLIWGDNKPILSSLKNGPLREEIEAAGGLKLIYIDPPFDVGADFSVEIEVGDETLIKEPSVIEEIAYRDTWGGGVDSYLSMMHLRLCLMRDLLADDGSIYVHCDWRTNSVMRLVMDQVFGPDNMLNNVVWLFGLGGSSSRYWPRKHNDLMFYSKTLDGHYFEADRIPATSQRMKGQDKKCPDYWQIPTINNMAEERLSYDTQKPEALLERVISSSSRPGDLVADFFCGSGTTMAVAEKLGRKWVGCDLGRFAVHTSRKRLIGVQRQLKREDKPYRSFEILNLGRYERQYFLDRMMSQNGRLTAEQKEKVAAEREEQYLNLILQAYSAQRAQQMPPFHGRRGTAAVLVGPIDAPVTERVVNEAVDAAIEQGIDRVDALGFDFEMGLVPHAQDAAKGRGVNLALKYIPHDVFDKRAVEKGQVKFYDVAYVEAEPIVEKGRKVRVKLTDFGVFYRQGDVDPLNQESGGRAKKSAVIIDEGRVVKVTKGKGKDDPDQREVLTKQWTDWIDYWSVDFDYESRKEIIRRPKEGAAEPPGEDEYVQVWSGRYIFENEWQSFRTRRDRTLELTSAPHTYDEPGTYRIAVKVIDIFGNDTTRVVEVEV